MLGGQGFKVRFGEYTGQSKVQAILDQLTSRISNRNVRLNTRVTSIDWSGTVTVNKKEYCTFREQCDSDGGQLHPIPI